MISFNNTHLRISPIFSSWPSKLSTPKGLKARPPWPNQYFTHLDVPENSRGSHHFPYKTTTIWGIFSSCEVVDKTPPPSSTKGLSDPNVRQRPGGLSRLDEWRDDHEREAPMEISLFLFSLSLSIYIHIMHILMCVYTCIYYNWDCPPCQDSSGK